jgi:hypothetical protein
MRKMKILLVYAADERNETLSYQQTWPGQVSNYPAFDCLGLNLLAGKISLSRLNQSIRRILFKAEAVIFLHSVFSNSRHLTAYDIALFRKMKCLKVFFIGNEYKLMPEKMELCESMAIDLLLSQSNSKSVHDLYRERLGCKVDFMPNTGFDPKVFKPVTAFEERPIDIGYRALNSPLYLGHDERRQIADFFSKLCTERCMKSDISLDFADRLGVDAWAVFLNRCKAQIGTEAGGDYFELDDRTRLKFKEYLKDHPDITIDETREIFFKDYKDPLPMRIISGRNVEAAATGTLQILFEGEYGGFLRPDEHYIALKKDFSNIEEVLSKFRDEYYCRRVIDNARQLALEQFTYEKLLERFRNLLKVSLGI